jgi:hypothetical protein
VLALYQGRRKRTGSEPPDSPLTSSISLRREDHQQNHCVASPRTQNWDLKRSYWKVLGQHVDSCPRPTEPLLQACSSLSLGLSSACFWGLMSQWWNSWKCLGLDFYLMMRKRRNAGRPVYCKEGVSHFPPHCLAEVMRFHSHVQNKCSLANNSELSRHSTKNKAVWFSCMVILVISKQDVYQTKQ